MGDDNRCFVDLFDNGLSTHELLLVGEVLVGSSKVLSLNKVLPLKNLSGLA